MIEKDVVIIQGIVGNWVQLNGFYVFLNKNNEIFLPNQYQGISFKDFKGLDFSPTNINLDKLNVIKLLIQTDNVGYKILSDYLNSLLNIISLGNQIKAEAEQFEKLNEFLSTYQPKDEKMGNSLREYQSNNQDNLKKLSDLIAQSANIFNDKDVLKKSLNVPINKKLFIFPFLEQEDLFLGNVEDYKIIHQEWNYSGIHDKMWISIKGLPFLVSGYVDDEYSAVNRVLASQLGKLLGLPCEEVFLAFFHDKCVNLTAFKACVSISENQMFELYELNHLNYLYQNEQKKCFNFLIQNWASAIKIDRNMKEKFTNNFIDEKGNVFVSQLDKCLFLTPQQIPKNLMLPFEINSFNYKTVKDLVEKVSKIDLVEVAFGSIADNFLELHDIEAEKLNKPTYFEKKDSFESNFNNLIKSLKEFEGLVNQNG